MSGLTFEIGAREARVFAGPYIIAEIAVSVGGWWKERRDGTICGVGLADASATSSDDVRALLRGMARGYVDRYKVWIADYEKRAAAARAQVQRLEDRAYVVGRRLSALRAALGEGSDG